MSRLPALGIRSRIDGAAPQHSRSRSQRAAIAMGAAVLVLAPVLSSAQAGAGTPSIGSVTFSGQVAGTTSLLQSVPGQFGTTLHGCQVGQESTQIIINVPNGNVILNGHKTAVKGAEITLNVTKVGDTEHSTPTTQSGVVYEFVVGSKTYSWSATSGTVSTKAKGNGGAFNVGLVPTGSKPGGIPAQSGGATKPVHATGSFSSCHAWI